MSAAASRFSTPSLASTAETCSSRSGRPCTNPPAPRRDRGRCQTTGRAAAASKVRRRHPTTRGRRSDRGGIARPAPTSRRPLTRDQDKSPFTLTASRVLAQRGQHRITLQQDHIQDLFSTSSNATAHRPVVASRDSESLRTGSTRAHRSYVPSLRRRVPYLWSPRVVALGGTAH